jgi:hypothetical protein
LRSTKRIGVDDHRDRKSQISSILNIPGPTRYIFYDAPLKELDENPMFTPSLSPMASASFSSTVGSRWVIPKLARKKILQYVKMGHDRGITVRITKPIDFPVWLRCVVAPLALLLPLLPLAQLTSFETPPGTCVGKCCWIAALTGWTLMISANYVGVQE